MEIKSLKGIKQVKNIIYKIREHIQEEGVIDIVLYDIYDNYIEVKKIIIPQFSEGLSIWY